MVPKKNSPGPGDRVGLWAEGTGFGLSLVWGFVIVGDEADSRLIRSLQQASSPDTGNDISGI